MPRDSCLPCCNPTEFSRTIDSYRSAELQILCGILSAVPSFFNIFAGNNTWTGTNQFTANWSSCTSSGTRLEIGVFTSLDKWFQISYNNCGLFGAQPTYYFTGGNGDTSTPFEFTNLVIGAGGFTSFDPAGDAVVTFGPNTFVTGSGTEPFGLELRNPNAQDIPGGVFALTFQNGVGLGYNSTFLGSPDFSGVNVGGAFIIDYNGTLTSQFSAVPGLKLVFESSATGGGYFISGQAISDANGYGYFDCPYGLVAGDDVLVAGTNIPVALGRQAFPNRPGSTDSGLQIYGLSASGNSVTAGFQLELAIIMNVGINVYGMGDTYSGVQGGYFRFDADTTQPIFSIHFRDLLYTSIDFPVMQVSSSDGAIALGTGHPDNRNSMLGTVHIVPYSTSQVVLAIQNETSSGSSGNLTEWLDKSGTTLASVDPGGNASFKHLTCTWFNWDGQARLTSDMSVTNSTTLTNSNLSVTVAGSTTYHFRACLFVDPDAVGGHQYDMGGTCTATSVIFQIDSIRNSTNAFVINSRQTALAGGGAGAVGGTAVFTVIEGTIVVNAGGTLVVKFAQNVASGTSKILTGSSFEVYEFP